MKIIVRGDCCSRRAIALNRDLFGGSPVTVANEKVPNVVFLDSLRGLTPTTDDLRKYVNDVDMGKSLRHYFTGQVDRSTLDVEDACLLVMDSYSDMNFSLWRHRAHGWQIWIHPGYLKDRDKFNEDFEDVGHRTIDQAIEDNVRLIAEYRRRNGNIAVLYLSQPIDYYPKLSSRSEFAYLGQALEERVANLYWGGNIEKSSLAPADVGSCGPGFTLHFEACTYRAMIRCATEQGLALAEQTIGA